MKKHFKVIYDNGTEKRVFKTVAKNEKEAIYCFRANRKCSYKIVDIVVYTPEDNKYVASNIFKIVLSLIVLLVIAVCAVIACKDPVPTSYEQYTVEEGDSLWKIATLSDGWNNMDASYIITAMKNKSNCTANIHAGQKVYIPMYND